MLLLQLLIVLVTVSVAIAEPSNLTPRSLRRSNDVPHISLYATQTSDQKQQLFLRFKGDHGKTYKDSAEEATRYQNFVNNLVTLDQRNKAEGAMVYGITKFTDLTDTEFASMYLGRKSSFRANALKMEAMAVDSPFNHLNHSSANLQAVNINWATSGRTTAIKDQGACGSCWAFSSAEQIESDTIRLTGTTYTLSPQQIVDCDFVDGACSGGNDDTAFQYVQGAGGIVQDSVYAYTSGTTRARGSCRTSVVSASKVVRLNSYSGLTSEQAVASYVQTTGPVTIYANADTWNAYAGGIMTASTCPSTSAMNLNHAIQIVGLVIPTSGTSYWIVRNQWGTGWGASGYIYLAYGTNTCGMFSDKAYYTSTSLINPSSVSAAPTFKPPTPPPTVKQTAIPTNKPPTPAPTVFRSAAPTNRPPTRAPTVAKSGAPSPASGTTWTCPAYFITPGWYPRSASPYVPCTITACGGSTVTASSYDNGGSCSGDTWVAILDAYGNQLARNDDANSFTRCSTVTYTVPTGTACQSYTLAQTCYPQFVYYSQGYLNCGGTFAVSGATALKVSTGSGASGNVTGASPATGTLALP